MTDRVRQNHLRGVLCKVAVQSVRSTQPTALHRHIVVLVVMITAAENRLSPTPRRLVACHNPDRRSQCILVPRPHPRGRPRLRRCTGNLTLHDGKRQFPDSLLCVTEDLVNGFALRYTPCTLIMELLFVSPTLPTHSLQLARHCYHRTSHWTVFSTTHRNYTHPSHDSKFCPMPFFFHSLSLQYPHCHTS